MIKIIGDTIYYDHQPVAHIIARTGTLRDNFVEALLTELSEDSALESVAGLVEQAEIRIHEALDDLEKASKEIADLRGI